MTSRSPKRKRYAGDIFIYKTSIHGLPEPRFPAR